MKIIVKRNEQQPKITLDLKDVHYPYAIRDAIQVALEIDGFTKETIAEIFNQMPDAKAEESVELVSNDCSFYQPDGSSAMNCKNCGKSKFSHIPNIRRF
jgi:ethanolamine utilization protein EutQ (cupin superfamily)